MHRNTRIAIQVVVSLAVFGVSLLVAFKKEQWQTITKVSRGVLLWQEELSRAVLENDFLFLEHAITSLGDKDLKGFEVATPRETVLSSPTPNLAHVCAQPRAVEIVRFQTPVATLRYCLDLRATWLKAVQSPVMLLSSFLILIANLIFISLSRAAKRKEEQLEILTAATTALIQQKQPSPFLVEQCPGIVEAWDKLSAEIEAGRNELLEARKKAAVAKLAQMLAHDVRKPFSILGSGLQLLKGCKTESERNEALEWVSRELDKATAKVSALIADVLEAGRETLPTRSKNDLSVMLRNAIAEVSLCNEDCDVSFSYELAHTGMPFVEARALERAFSNVIHNAFQAMTIMRSDGERHERRSREGCDGKMTFRSSDLDSETGVSGTSLKLVLGNDGPVIPEEVLSRLFESFFSKGKPDGTGLGLEIAKKIITAQGGRIWCESPGEIAPVEFHIVLPCVAGERAPSPALFSNSREARRRLKS